MQKIIKNSILVIAILGSVMACRKELPFSLKKQPTTSDDKKLEQRIKSFYVEMKSLQNHKLSSLYKTTSSGDSSLSVDSVQFLTQATYNYYVARNSTESMQSASFSFSEPLNSSGEIEQVDAADAFWRVRDSLLVTFDSISYPEKKLASLILDVKASNGEAIYTVIANITDGPGIDPEELETVDGNVVMKTTAGNANTVYSVLGSGPFSSVTLPPPFTGMIPKYGKGQATIDPQLGVILPYSYNYTRPDARTRIRFLAFNATPCLNFAITTGQLIVNNISFGMAYGNTTLPAPYATMPGFIQKDMALFHLYTDAAGNITDQDVNRKLWFTIPLINAFAYAIPSFVNQYINYSTTMQPVDINVWCSGIPAIPDNPNGVWMKQVSVRNFVTLGTVTTINLPNPTGLPTF